VTIDKSKALYHSGIPGADHEIPTPSKDEAEIKRAAYEAKAKFEKKDNRNLPKNNGAFKLDVVSEALRKTAK
jgi:hypothetical protein